MHSRFDLVHEVAARALGLVTRAQLSTIGIPERTISTWVSVGRLRVVTPGVYLVMGAVWTWEVRVLAACLAHGGAASHRTAAALLGVPEDRSYGAGDRQASRLPRVGRPLRPAHAPLR